MSAMHNIQNSTHCIGYSVGYSILYHYPCNDGLMSAAIFAECIEKTSVNFHPVNYGSEDTWPAPEQFKGRFVICVDFSIFGDYLDAVLKECEGFIMLDHHVTAHSKLIDLDKSSTLHEIDITKRRLSTKTKGWYYRSNLSGAGLAWLFCYDREPELYVDYVQSRDLWQFKNPEYNSDVLDFYWGFQNQSQDPMEIAVDKIVKGTLDWTHDILKEGSIVRKFNERQEKKYIENAIHGTLEPLSNKTLFVNCPGIYASNVGNILAKCSPSGVAVCWNVQGGKTLVSLRSIDGNPDVSKIAEIYGGGGHASAAGFHLDKSIDHCLTAEKPFIYGPRFYQSRLFFDMEEDDSTEETEYEDRTSYPYVNTEYNTYEDPTEQFSESSDDNNTDTKDVSKYKRNFSYLNEVQKELEK